MLIYVVGSSMEDTLHGAYIRSAPGGDFIYIIKTHEVSRGDIVVIDTEDEQEDENSEVSAIIKRVIAVGGDTVELRRGVLYLNGVLTKEPYVDEENNDPDNKNNTYACVTVPAGTVFCMGDNRNISSDSRGKYGFIETQQIIGKATSWSLTFVNQVTAFNTFFEFTLPSWFR